MTTNALTISQAITDALKSIAGLAVINGRETDWIKNPVYPVLVIEPQRERLEAISSPKIKYIRTWALELFVEQDEPEAALTLLMREIFKQLNLATSQPLLEGARLSAGDVSFNLFLEQKPQSSAVFQLSATFVE